MFSGLSQTRLPQAAEKLGLSMSLVGDLADLLGGLLKGLKREHVCHGGSYHAGGFHANWFEAGSLTLEVSDDELARRRAAWQPPAPKYTHGVPSRYTKLVTSADKGAYLS